MAKKTRKRTAVRRSSRRRKVGAMDAQTEMLLYGVMGGVTGFLLPGIANKLKVKVDAKTLGFIPLAGGAFMALQMKDSKWKAFGIGLAGSGAGVIANSVGKSLGLVGAFQQTFIAGPGQYRKPAVNGIDKGEQMYVAGMPQTAARAVALMS